MNLLGIQPDDPVRAREWLRHIGVIAAYRDQHKVIGEDPRQVLGPYAEPSHAGHDAYWHAAESVLAARRLAGLEPAGTAVSQDGRTLAQLAADIYRALPGNEREAIATAIAATSGTMWLGDPAGPDEHAAIQPGYADALIAALTRRRLMTTAVGTARVQPEHHRRPLEADLARRRRSSKPRRTAPTAAEPAQQPGPEVPIRHTPAPASPQLGPG